MLMLDADAATDISDLEKLEGEMDLIERGGHGAVVGSRYHLQEDAVAQVLLLLLVVWLFGCSVVCCKL